MSAQIADRWTALYVRESRGSRSVAAQEADLGRWAEGREEEVRFYRDTWSGRDSGRPGWSALVADVAAGRVGMVVCWRLDRLGLTCSELSRLFEDLAGRGVNLISLKDRLDLATPVGRRMAGALASVGLFESELRAERILAGQEAARARGIRWGGSVKGRRLKVTPEQEATVRRLRAEGVKVSHIARQTGLSRPTIYRILGDAPDPERPP